MSGRVLDFAIRVPSSVSPTDFGSYRAGSVEGTDISHPVADALPAYAWVQSPRVLREAVYLSSGPGSPGVAYPTRKYLPGDREGIEIPSGDVALLTRPGLWWPEPPFGMVTQGWKSGAN